MSFGSKPPFTLQTAQQTVKTLQALWDTRDPKQILTAYAPNCVWRGRNWIVMKRTTSAITSNADKQYAFLSGLLAYKQEYLRCMKLHGFNSRRLSIKWLAEGHGDRKHLEDSIFRQKSHDYPGKEGKRWKRHTGLEYNVFDEHGKIQEVLNLSYTAQIKKEARLLHGISEVDKIHFPRIAMYDELVEKEGRLESKTCALYYV